MNKKDKEPTEEQPCEGDVLKEVVEKHCDLDKVEKKLNTITHYCTSTNNEVCINRW